MSLLQRFSAPPDLHLVEFEGKPRSICGLPGTRQVLVGLEQGLAVIDVDAHTVRTLDLAIVDKYGDPIVLSALAGAADGVFVGATIDTAHFLRLEDGVVQELGRATLHSQKSTGGSMFIDCDAAAQVLVATAADHLVRASRGGDETFENDGADWQRFYWGAAVAADGSQVANGRCDGEVQVRDPVTLEIRTVLTGLSACPIAMAFSPDGAKLAAADDTTRARIWTVEEGGEGVQLQGLAKLTHLQWLPDGSGVVFVGLTRQLGVIDPDQPDAPVATLPEGYDTRYFTGGALVGEDTLAVLVEERGVLVARFNS